MRVVAAVLAAGKAERFGGDKVTVPLGNKPVWRWSFDCLLFHPLIDAVGLVVPPGRTGDFDCRQAAFVIEGGHDRQESSKLAVEASDGEIVLLHDAARPFPTHAMVARVIEAIERCGAAAPAVPIQDTLRTRTPAGFQVVDRSKMVGMQTPQGGRRDLILRAHREAARLYTDEMSLVEAIAETYEIVEGDPQNFKITTVDDLRRARAIVENMETRTGIGYDIHRFSSSPDRPLMLGGVRFLGETGLDGHSDADVVIHAAADALFGAAGLGDIGQHFPNTDPQWRDAPSITFLRHARSLLASEGWGIVNLDITMIGEKPKVMHRAEEIRRELGAALAIDPERVSFKATTNEGMGSLGRGEGIAAHAVATIRQDRG